MDLACHSIVFFTKIVKMQNKRVEIYVYGIVQGVGFRWHTEKKAAELGLTGWCKNVSDGSVLIQVQGNEDAIKRFIEWSYNGVPRAAVDRIESTPMDIVPAETAFTILH